MSAMTNNEAIGILAIVVETAKGRCFVTDEAISDAYDMAISALKAQEAKVQLSAEGTTNLQPTCNQLATEQPERKTGRWINHRNDNGHNIADCDQCREAMQWFDDDIKPNYCPNCGADMGDKE